MRMLFPPVPSIVSGPVREFCVAPISSAATATPAARMPPIRQPRVSRSPRSSRAANDSNNAGPDMLDMALSFLGFEVRVQSLPIVQFPTALEVLGVGRRHRGVHKGHLRAPAAARKSNVDDRLGAVLWPGGRFPGLDDAFSWLKREHGAREHAVRRHLFADLADARAMAGERRMLLAVRQRRVHLARGRGDAGGLVKGCKLHGDSWTGAKAPALHGGGAEDQSEDAPVHHLPRPTKRTQHARAK